MMKALRISALLAVLVAIGLQPVAVLADWNDTWWNGTNLQTMATGGTNVVPAAYTDRNNTFVSTQSFDQVNATNVQAETVDISGDLYVGGNIGVGTDPLVQFHLYSTNLYRPQFRCDAVNNTAGSASYFNLGRGRLSGASAIAPNAGDTLGNIVFKSCIATTAYNNAALISSALDDINATTANPAARLTFSTSITNSAALVERLRIGSAGNVGIGNTTLTYLLNMESSGGGYYSSSDHQWHNGCSKDWKTNIVDISTAIDTVMALRPKKYDALKLNRSVREIDSELIGKVAYTNDLISFGKQTFGFVADDVRLVIPEAVDVNKDDPSKVDGLTLQPITAFAVRAIQEQQSKIEALEARIRKLEEIIKP